jgi:hypothetical protein
VKRKIVNFDTDDEGHWRARLECGHYQHLRHRPPLESRPWILDESERVSRIGAELNCVKCDPPRRSFN